MASEKILACSKLLAGHGLSVAFAESATAGWLCSEFALAPESGKVLMGGIVCYDASLKESILGVSAQLIKQFTPESQEVTEQLAHRLPLLIAADICVGVTGLTTAGGSETAEKPVGTMFISALIKGEIVNLRKVFKGSCEEIIHQTVDAVAELLMEQVAIKMN